MSHRGEVKRGMLLALAFLLGHLLGPILFGATLVDPFYK
jgi:hypothetical protein